MPPKQSDETKLALLEQKMGQVDTKVDEIKGLVTELSKEFKANYVTKEEFAPIQKIVYGIVSAFGLAIVGAVISLVINTKP